MVGGTKLPPKNSQSEPGCNERKTRATARTKAKTLYEGKRQKPSQVYVSLDNADTVIGGAPHFPSFGEMWDPLKQYLPHAHTIPILALCGSLSIYYPLTTVHRPAFTTTDSVMR